MFLIKGILVFCVFRGVFGTVEIHDQGHFSKHAHYEGEEHNIEYDHDAFLGPKRADEFEHLSEEEAKKRLRAMIPRLDKDEDGLISRDELEAWLNKQRKAFMYEHVEEAIAEQDKDGDKLINWEEYMRARFGVFGPDNNPQDEALRIQLRHMKFKFDAADMDKNGKMDEDEYVIFLHPEEAEHMEQIAIDEILQEVDKDGDGHITMDEFLSQYGDHKQAPEWVEREREAFAKSFDTNGNGKLDREEMHKWAIPSRGESREETEHLMDSTDENADGFLSMEEIILHYDLFVGSTATEHGETLRRMAHDEF